MTRLRRAIVIALLLSSSGCSAATPDASGNEGQRAGFAGGGPVLLLGDSILVGADEIGRVRELLEERGWEPELDAVEGRSPRTAIEIVTARASVPRDVVLVLGSNPGPALGDFPAEIDEMLDALRARGARRIVWIPPRHADPERYAERVEALMAAAAIERGLSVPDWGAIVDEHPWIIGSDRLHLSAQGTVMLAYYIGSALSVANGGAGPATIPDPESTPPAATYQRTQRPAPASSSSPTPTPSATKSQKPSPSPSASTSPSSRPTVIPTTPSVLPTASPSASPTPSAEPSPS